MSTPGRQATTLSKAQLAGIFEATDSLEDAQDVDLSLEWQEVPKPGIPSGKWLRGESLKLDSAFTHPSASNPELIQHHEAMTSSASPIVAF